MGMLTKKSRCLVTGVGLVVVAGLFLSACTTYVTPVRTVNGPHFRHAWVPGHYDRFGGWVPGHYR